MTYEAIISDGETVLKRTDFTNFKHAKGWLRFYIKRLQHGNRLVMGTVFPSGQPKNGVKAWSNLNKKVKWI